MENFGLVMLLRDDNSQTPELHHWTQYNEAITGHTYQIER
jgi:hypothetical protein